MIDIYDEVYKKGGKKEDLYRNISVQLSEEMGLAFKPRQVKNRWTYLRGIFDTEKLKVNQSGAGASRWKFFDLMDQVIGKVHSVRPVVLASSSRGLLGKRHIETLSSDSEEESGETVPLNATANTPRKVKSKRGPTAQSRSGALIEEYLKRQEEERRERMQILIIKTPQKVVQRYPWYCLLALYIICIGI